MKSLWSDGEAVAFSGDLGQCVFSTRLLGREPTLVLHAGGHTSVKINEKNVFGEDEPVLYVKGSGVDLAHIEASDFAPLRLAPLLKLASLPALCDSEMMNALGTQRTRVQTPTPSVDAMLHAVLPFKFVCYTPADALLAIMNSRGGAARTRDIYADIAVVLPYATPGVDLARSCAEYFPAKTGPRTIGMILLQHGVFSFGSNAREAYERMIDLVTRAEDYLAKHSAWNISAPALTPGPVPLRRELAALRHAVSKTAGFPLVLSAHTDSRSLAFVRRDDLAKLTQQGPATPAQVLHTKRLPLLGRDADAYAEAYRKYFESHATQANEPKTMLDPAPRVLLDPQLGVCTFGRSGREAAKVHDIYSHTIDIQLRAARLGGYQALSAKEIFDVEYSGLEQADPKNKAQHPLFAGEVALVTGAASEMGRACIESLLARGAAVIGLDSDTAIAKLHKRPDFAGIVCDVTDEPRLVQAIEYGVRAFGGLDMLILNASLLPPAARIEALATAEWHKVMRLNLDANLVLLREAYPLLKFAPNGGRVVVIGSPSSPSVGAAVYSASKAALLQLARVAALEWAGDNIRLNSLHPDEVLATSDKRTQDFAQKNSLPVEVLHKAIAELAAELCGPLFSKTTGAQIPVNGGNPQGF